MDEDHWKSMNNDENQRKMMKIDERWWTSMKNDEKSIENDEKCKDYLKQRWDKHLRLRKIVYLEEEFI